ncbi:hypothetical protein ACWD48_05895 [Streptomyces sp. NPDC002519]
MANTPSIDWWNKHLPPEDRALGFVDHAMDQVEGLLDYITGPPTTPWVIRVACIESFWVNVRLLTEFLVKLTNETRNCDARAFAPTWTKPTGDTAQRLLNDWNTASAYVMHMGKELAPEDLTDITPVTDEDLRQTAYDCRTVYEEFIETLRQSVSDSEQA